MTDFVWRPEDHPWTRDSHVAQFLARHGMRSVDELRRRSIADTDWFWQEVMRELEIEWEHPYACVRDDSRGFPWTRWFVGGQVNVTHHCVDRHVRDGHGGEAALYHPADPDRPEDVTRVTFGELAEQVLNCAGALCAAGIGRGDSVAMYAPMQVPTVVVLFATMKIGARFVPIFCGYGEAALRERLTLCDAKILFACAGLRRRGNVTDTGSIAGAAAAAVPSLRRIVWTDTGDWTDFCAGGRRGLLAEPPSSRGAAGGYTIPVSTEAEDPCLILFTSGTTGRPKGTVHTHVGCLAQMGKELRYAFNVQPGEPFFWVTDIGWMMGPWELIGCLLHRTPVVLLDDVPNHPTSDRLWQICERLGVVTLGLSPTLVRLLMRAKDGVGPSGHDLSRLRVLGSTGEVWDEVSYRWYFEQVGQRRCPVINISGGTELVGCHLSPTPLDPLKPCSLGGPGLGMDVDVFTDEGQPAPRGVMGHLVCKQPAPSMTKSFLGEDDRYLATYFPRFPGVWYHGDWAMIDADGQWFLFGRTDDTLKVAGKRVGPGEVEDVLIGHPAVSEAAVIGVPDEVKGTALVCFVVLKSGRDERKPVDSQGEAPGGASGVITFAHGEESELIEHITKQLGKPLAPKRVFAIAALPKTRSGKIVRGAIQRVFLGEAAGDLTSVENPSAFDLLAALGAAERAAESWQKRPGTEARTA
jgi:acetyl-CoA synthetase